LKAASGWLSSAGDRGNGTDEYGFSALPGGGEPDRIENDDIFGAWWTTMRRHTDDAVNVRITIHQDELSGLSTEKSDMYSVRCVMDKSN
jgi:uncharacterized protein (TIGR02145 family)